MATCDERDGSAIRAERIAQEAMLSTPLGAPGGKWLYLELVA
jgi:hypothetical protein